MGTLKAKNRRGDTISFTDPLRLVRIDGLSGLRAENYYSESTMDGSTRTGTKLSNRNLEIEFQIRKTANWNDYLLDEQKSKIFKVFNPKENPIRLDITSKTGKQYYLHANVDVTPTFSKENPAYASCLIQLSCDDPYIYESNIEKVDIALWVGTFEFPLEIPSAGIEMGYRSQSLIVNVPNEGQAETGMIIRFKALGTVVNPYLINVNTQESIKLNTTMTGGDVIEVSTFTGNKYIKLIRNGVTHDALNTLVITSNFLQLDIGDNLFRYNADENLDNLEVDIQFRNILLGV
ncbi:phage tail family protein [Caldifermentibacillus hisashii]|uniref:phage tail family protein n=1 Tax=Caldifermentibacillus hisashii TaxID=996558 RepID=UPI00310151E3